jgi:hypothetical protein
MRIDDPYRGRTAVSRHYAFGSQDGIMGTSVQSRNPNVTPAENVINTLLDVFFAEIATESGLTDRWSAARSEKIWRTIQLLSNPVFHMRCEALKRMQLTDALKRLRFFVKHGEESLRSLKGVMGESLTPIRYGRFHWASSDFAPSVDQLVETCNEWDKQYSAPGGASRFSRFRAHSAFESARAASEWSVERAKPFQGYDFQSLMTRMADNGTPPDASKSDYACEKAKNLYRGFATFAVNYASLVITDKEIKRLLVSHEISTLEETGRLAEEAVVARLNAARAEERARQELEAEKLAALGQARLEEYRLEAAAAQRAEELRLKLVEEDRERGLRDFHSRFQEVQLPESILALMGKLKSGSGIPTPQRRNGELIVTQVLNPLRLHLIDLRGDAYDRMGDPAVERFASLIFSPSTIALIAKSFGIDSEKCFNVTVHSGRSPIESNVSKLCELYESSPAVRGMVKTMLNQADGIIVLAALALPPSEVVQYARERDWNGLGVDRAGRELRQPFAQKLLKVIEDKIIVRVARESLPDLEPIGEKKRMQIEIPPWVDEVINPEEFAYALAEGQLLIAPREAPTLAMYIPTKGFSSKEVFQRQYKQKLNELLADVEVEKRLEYLERCQGFRISRNPEESVRRMTVSHPEYEISVALEGLSSRWHGELDTLEQRFHQCETGWRLLLERAQRVGFGVIRGCEGVSLSHPSLGEYSLASGQFVPVQQLHRVTALVDEAERRHHVQVQHDVIKRQRAAHVERVLQSEVLPGPTDEIVVPDANVFMTLVAAREGGGTWLDLLNATASLKHVRMMIPAIVADFELTGRVMPFDSGGQRDSAFSMLSWTSSAVQIFREFFDGATRIKVERRPDGSTAVAGAILGSNRNLVIVESPDDEVFYDRVRALEIEAQGNTRAFHDLVREQMYHAGEGDAAISRFLQHSPFVNHVTVITSDIRYMRKSMPLTTGCGAPVSGCSIGSYVAAECELRGGSLAELLGSSESVHFHSIAKDVTHNETQRGGYISPLFAHSVLGRGRIVGVTPKGILSVLRES